MTEDEKKSSRKLTAYERWELPHLQDPAPKQSSGPAVLVQSEATVAAEEVDQDSLVYEPLTASQLEEIRSAAYEEGFSQGKEDGWNQGLEEGRLEGLDQGRQEGHEEGKEAGFAEGKEEALAEAREKLSYVESLVNQIADELQAPLEASRDSVEKVVYQTVSRLVQNITQVQLTDVAQETLSLQLKHALDATEGFASSARIRVNPSDLEFVKEMEATQRIRLQFEADPGIEQGGFFLDGKNFFVDGSIETRLSQTLAELDQLKPESEN